MTLRRSLHRCRAWFRRRRMWQSRKAYTTVQAWRAVAAQPVIRSRA